MTDSARILQIAGDLERSLGDGDLVRMRGLMHPDARIWHSADACEQTLDENLAGLEALLTVCERMWYEEARVTVTVEGYVSQHLLCCALHGGATVRLPVCQVVRVEGGVITRAWEYADASGLAPVFAALAEN